MKNLFRELFLGSLMLIINACELFSPKEWAKYERGKAKRGTIKDHFVKGIRLEKSQNARQINFIISEKMIENLLKILLNF